MHARQSRPLRRQGRRHQPDTRATVQPCRYDRRLGTEAGARGSFDRQGRSAGTAVRTPGTNSYGGASACGITQDDHLGTGVSPLLDSSFGTGGSHDPGALQPGAVIAVNVANLSTDLASPGNLTALTLRSFTLSEPGLFELTGFAGGMQLDAGHGLGAFSLHAGAGQPTGPLSFTLTLNTDQFAIGWPASGSPAPSAAWWQVLRWRPNRLPQPCCWSPWARRGCRGGGGRCHPPPAPERPRRPATSEFAPGNAGV